MSEVELRASFEAWAHSECGLTFPEMAQYTTQELERLQLGYLVREHPTDPIEEGPLASQKRSIRRGHRQAREEMLADLGFD